MLWQCFEKHFLELHPDGTPPDTTEHGVGTEQGIGTEQGVGMDMQTDTVEVDGGTGEAPFVMF